MASTVVSRILFLVGIVFLGASVKTELSHPPCQHITTAGKCLDRDENWGTESTLAGIGFALLAGAWFAGIAPPVRSSINIERHGWR